MNRKKEMENVLKTLYKIALKIGNDFSMDTVYDYLTQGIVDDNKKGKINDLFPSFIEYFKNKKNIKVFIVLFGDIFVNLIISFQVKTQNYLIQ